MTNHYYVPLLENSSSELCTYNSPILSSRKHLQTTPILLLFPSLHWNYSSSGLKRYHVAKSNHCSSVLISFDPWEAFNCAINTFMKHASFDFCYTILLLGFFWLLDYATVCKSLCVCNDHLSLSLFICLLLFRTQLTYHFFEGLCPIHSIWCELQFCFQNFCHKFVQVCLNLFTVWEIQDFNFFYHYIPILY